MKKIPYLLTVILAVLAGLAGGIGSTHFLSKTMVHQEGILAANEFRLVDNEGLLLAALAARDGEPLLSFYTKDEKVRVSLGARPDGDLALALHHQDGHVAAIFGVTYEGAPFLEMLNAEEKVIWSAP
jgi:hypothetical protein